MTREIKFRAWHTRQKKMFSAAEMARDQMTLLPTGQFINVNGVSLKSSKIHDTMIPLQWTGLKDKNGVEIYEGDVLEAKHYYASCRWWSSLEEAEANKISMNEQRSNPSLCRMVVGFKDGGFSFLYPIYHKHVNYGEYFESGSGNGINFEEKYWDFEVIGNIHSNPDLIALPEE